MGANAREYLKVTMEKKLWTQIPQEYRSQMEMQYVEVEGIDYSHDDLWCKLKKESVKAYKKLKDREFYLRHNTKQ